MEHARKRAKLTAAVGILTMLFGAMLVLAPSAGADLPEGTVTIVGGGNVPICHASNAETNPYIMNSPSYSATGDVTGVNHEGHNGPVFQLGMKAQKIEWGDIIPPISLDGTTLHYPGKNWTDAARRLYAVCIGELPAPTGSISVDKHLAGNDTAAHASDVFNFTLSCTADDEAVVLTAGDASFTLTESQQAKTVANIPTGSLCTVTETGVSNPVSITVDDDTATTTTSRSGILIGDGTTRDVDVTNTFDRVLAGSLSVDKHLSGNDAATHADDVFTFSASCTEDDEPVSLEPGDASFTLTATQDPKQISGIPTGAVCTVTETLVNGIALTNPVSITVDGDEATTTASRSGITIGDGTNRDVDVTNTFSRTITPGCTDNPNTPEDECNPAPPEPEPELGSLTITKVVAGEDAPESWSFRFDGGNLSTFDLSDARDSIPFTDLPEGDYTITELSAGAADLTSIVCTDGSAGTIADDSDGGSVTVALDEGEAVECTFINTFPEVLPAEEEPEPEPEPEPDPEPSPAPQPGQVKGEQVARLPRTGNESGRLAVFGLTLLVLGATLVGGSRLRLRHLE